MPGEGNRQGQTIRGEGEGTSVPMRPENDRVSASTATGAQRGIGLQEREENYALHPTYGVRRENYCQQGKGDGEPYHRGQQDDHTG